MLEIETKSKNTSGDRQFYLFATKISDSGGRSQWNLSKTETTITLKRWSLSRQS